MRAPVQPLRGRLGSVAPAATAAVLVAAVVVLVTATGTLVARGGPEPGAGAERALPLLLVVIGLVALAAGPTVAWAARSDLPLVAVGLAVAAIAVALPLWSGWSGLPAAVRATVLAAGPLAVGGLAQVVLRWTRRSGGVALRVTWAAVIAAAVLHTLGYNPFADPKCDRICADVPVALGAVLPTTAVISASATLVVVAAAVATSAVARQTAEAPLSVRVAVAGALIVLAAATAVRASAWGGPTGARILIVIAPLTIGLVAAAVAAVLARTGRTRAAVDMLIRQLADPHGTPGGGPAWLRAIQFAVPGEERWVDRTGAEAASPGPEHQVVVLPDRAGPAVRLLLAPGTDTGDVLGRLTPAQQLAVSNARLTAVARTRLADLQASQRRAVARADAERSRIERDLHDGAQQRLVGAAFHLSLARAHATPAQESALTRAQDVVQTSLARLRRTTQGPFPPALADEGLAAALEDLVQDSEVLVQLECRGDLGVSTEAARAAYAVVVGALAVGGTRTSARVSVDRADGRVRIGAEVSPAPAVPADDIDIADRVGALGGAYERTWRSATLSVTAVIPCGS